MKFITTILMLAVLGLTAGCDSTETKDLEVDFSGRYEADQIIFDASGERLDALAAGLTIWMQIDEIGAVTGEMFVPASMSEDEIDETITLDGTWTNVESVLSFSMDADTFIKDLPWTFYPDKNEYNSDMTDDYEVKLIKN